eukprot:g149.t1
MYSGTQNGTSTPYTPNAVYTPGSVQRSTSRRSTGPASSLRSVSTDRSVYSDAGSLRSAGATPRTPAPNPWGHGRMGGREQQRKMGRLSSIYFRKQTRGGAVGPDSGTPGANGSKRGDRSASGTRSTRDGDKGRSPVRRSRRLAGQDPSMSGGLLRGRNAVRRRGGTPGSSYRSRSRGRMSGRDFNDDMPPVASLSALRRSGGGVGLQGSFTDSYDNGDPEDLLAAERETLLTAPAYSRPERPEETDYLADPDAMPRSSLRRSSRSGRKSSGQGNFLTPGGYGDRDGDSLLLQDQSSSINGVITPHTPRTRTPLQSDGQLDGRGRGSEGAARLDCWVTVFGFKPSQTADILQHFTDRQLVVLDHRAGQGNCMDIQFATPEQALRAEEEDGAKVDLGGVSIYIGAKRTRAVALQQRRVPVTLPRRLGRVVGVGGPGGRGGGQQARLRHGGRSVRDQYMVMDRTSIMKEPKRQMSCCEMVQKFFTQGW